MKLLDLYSEYIANWISDGNMVNRDKISLLGIRPLFDRFLTNQYITKVWQVCLIPVNYDKNLTQMIRTEMYERHPSVSTIIHMYNIPVGINVGSDTFKRHMGSAARRYEQYAELFNSLSDVDKATGIVGRDNSGAKVSINSDTLQEIRDTYDSYMYVHEKVSAGKAFTNTYYFIQASAKNKREIQKYDKDLMMLLAGEGIYVRRVRGNMSRYLDNFCPAALVQGDINKFPSMLFSQENIAAFMPNVTKGLVGKQGFMIAMDWQTKLPFRLDLTSSGTAQVIVVVGATGSGKTQLTSTIVVELTSFQLHCSVTDIKGGEWGKLSKFVDTLEIDMSGDSARFVNLLRLDDLNCTTENCQEAYDAAVSNTVGLFEVCTNLQPTEGNETDMRSILNQAVEKLYSKNGVEKKNPKTFDVTKTFKYEQILDIISDLEHSKAYTEDQKRLCRLIKTRCAAYFLGEGRYSAAFKNELTVADVLFTPLIVYNFNKNKGESLDIIDEVRIFMAQCLDSRKCFIRKQQGLHQAVIYEELQRCGSMKTLIRNISANVTGSRSNNLSVFLLLNAVSTFDSENFAAIRSNITTMMVGKCKNEDIRKLVQSYDCKPIERYMQKINRNVGGQYSFCFAVAYDVGNDKDSLIIKAVVPDEIGEVLKTRDSLIVG